MMVIVLANLISLIGCILMVVIGLFKDRKHILKAQCAQWFIMGVSNLMLGGVTGFISNMVSIVRNVYTLKKDLTKPVKLGFILLQIVISAAFNQSGMLGWLPIIAAVALTMFVDVKDERVLKLALIFGQSLWTVFDFSLMNYTAFAFDLVTIVSTVVGIRRLSKRHAVTQPA